MCSKSAHRQARREARLDARIQRQERRMGLEPGASRQLLLGPGTPGRNQGQIIGPEITELKASPGAIDQGVSSTHDAPPSYDSLPATTAAQMQSGGRTGSMMIGGEVASELPQPSSIFTAPLLTRL